MESLEKGRRSSTGETKDFVFANIPKSKTLEGILSEALSSSASTETYGKLTTVAAYNSDSDLYKKQPLNADDMLVLDVDKVQGQFSRLELSWPKPAERERSPSPTSPLVKLPQTSFGFDPNRRVIQLLKDARAAGDEEIAGPRIILDTERSSLKRNVKKTLSGARQTSPPSSATDEEESEVEVTGFAGKTLFPYSKGEQMLKNTATRRSRKRKRSAFKEKKINRLLGTSSPLLAGAVSATTLQKQPSSSRREDDQKQAKIHLSSSTNSREDEEITTTCDISSNTAIFVVKNVKKDSTFTWLIKDYEPTSSSADVSVRIPDVKVVPTNNAERYAESPTASGRRVVYVDCASLEEHQEGSPSSFKHFEASKTPGFKTRLVFEESERRKSSSEEQE